MPAYNEERLLGDTLDHIRQATSAFTSRGWGSEIIVCNNNSTDQTAAIAESFGARVVFEPVNQISRARNRGAAAASGDWLIFVDADSQPSVGLFQDVAGRIERGDSVGGGAEIEMVTSRFFGRFFSALWNRVSCWGRLMAGSFIFVEGRVFRKLGGFSEDLFAGEELEFATRLKALAAEEGRTVVILADHPLRTSGRKVELYGTWELAGFFLRSLFAWRRVLRNRDACHPWYDGRR